MINRHTDTLDFANIIDKLQHQHDNLETWSEGHAVHHIFSRTMNRVLVDGYRRDDGQRAIRYRIDGGESIDFQNDNNSWFVWEWLDGIGALRHFEEISRLRT